MPERYELSYELTREDWLAFGALYTREGPSWTEALDRHKRAMRRQTLWGAPFLIGGASLWIGRSDGTAGMYLQGAALGTLFAGFLYFALPRLNTVEKAKKTFLEKAQRMDLSVHEGKMTLAIDELGVRIQSPYRQMTLSWQLAAPAKIGGFTLFYHTGQDVTLIPARVWASEAEATEFFEQVKKWWQAGQLPNAARVERYLADRDRSCPRCKYNLRGVRGEACPEYGEALRIETLAAV